MTQPPLLGVIGAGKVGQTLARMLAQAGYTVGAVHSRTPAHAESLAQQVGARVTDSPAAVLESVDLTLLTVPDDAVRSLAETLAAGDLSGKMVVHTSGALDARSLSLLAARGAKVGSLHPAYPFASVDTAMTGLPGATFAIEAEDEALMACLGDMVHALNGTILKLETGDKAIYHAALVIASNYTVILYDVARRLLLSLNASEDASDSALNSLLAETVRNIETRGVPDALTGPLVRGDTGTLRAHLDALARYDPQIAALYRDLARQALPMLAVSSAAVQNLLEEESTSCD